MSLEKFFQSCMIPKDSDMFKADTKKDGALTQNIAITAMIMVYL